MTESQIADCLECSVCLEQLDVTSRVLPCQHTFCKRCLQDIVRSHKELRCPECRMLVTDPVDQLPSNILLMRILEGLKISHIGSDPSRVSVASPKRVPLALDHNHTSAILPSANYSPIATTGLWSNNAANGIARPVANFPQSVTSSLLPNYSSLSTSSLSIAPGGSSSLLPGVSSPLTTSVSSLIPTSVSALIPTSVSSFLTPNRERSIASSSWISFNSNESLPSMANSIQSQSQTNMNVTSTALCKALYDFEMTNRQDGCLTFRKGDTIRVFGRVDENWAEGALVGTGVVPGGRSVGIFPICFVELNEAAKQLLMVTQVSVNNMSRGTSQCHSSPIATRSTNPFLNATCGTSSAVATSYLMEKNNDVVCDVNADRCNSGSCAVDVRTKAPAPLVRERFRCIAPYPACGEYDLELQFGDVIYVHKKRDDGWFKGTLLRTGKTGLFPASFVEPS